MSYALATVLRDGRWPSATRGRRAGTGLGIVHKHQPRREGSGGAARKEVSRNDLSSHSSLFTVHVASALRLGRPHPLIRPVLVCPVIIGVWYRGRRGASLPALRDRYIPYAWRGSEAQGGRMHRRPNTIPIMAGYANIGERTSFGHQAAASAQRSVRCWNASVITA